jgi:hypothetical protein
MVDPQGTRGGERGDGSRSAQQPGAREKPFRIQPGGIVRRIKRVGIGNKRVRRDGGGIEWSFSCKRQIGLGL